MWDKQTGGCLEYEWRAANSAQPSAPLLPQPSSACFREDIGMRAGRCVDGRVAVIRHYNDYTQWQPPPLQPRHGPLTPVSMRSHCLLLMVCNGTKSIGSNASASVSPLSGVDFIMQQRRNVVTFPRLCRDGIGRSIFLHKGRNALG